MSNTHLNHDHARCIDNALAAARDLCQSKGQRFTSLREKIFTLLWQSHIPVSAYELLATLRQESPNAKPPTVYRTLDFLQQLHLIHRVDSLNAYIGCCNPTQAHPTQLFICKRCGVSREIENDKIEVLLADYARINGLSIDNHQLEVKGLCAACTAGH